MLEYDLVRIDPRSRVWGGVLNEFNNLDTSVQPMRVDQWSKAILNIWGGGGLS